jgi:hypothetical protein
MTSRSARPELSVIMLTPDSGASLRRTIRALAAQSVRDRIELVFVMPLASQFAIEPDLLAPFAPHQIVEIGSMTSTALARAAGVRAARAPLVAFAEDHSFPMEGWASALIEAHRGPWAGVGPVIRNANPGTRMSWVNLLVEYAPWLDPIPAGEYDHIPGHNSSYKRDVLISCGDALPDILEAESVLQWDLRRRGHRFAIAPAARTCHENFSKPGASFALQFHSGRLFAANRARDWSPARRAFYTMAAPLIPVVRFTRMLGAMKRIGLRRSPALVTLVALMLTTSGAGELVGYASGSGRSNRRLTDHEFNRERFIKPYEHAP